MLRHWFCALPACHPGVIGARPLATEAERAGSVAQAVFALAAMGLPSRKPQRFIMVTQYAQEAMAFAGITAAMAGSIAIAVANSGAYLTVAEAVEIARRLPRVSARKIMEEIGL